MSNFNVPDMSCGHCVAALEKAIKAVDPTARVLCDLDAHTVAIESSASDVAVSDAIRAAGYEVQVAQS